MNTNRDLEPEDAAKIEKKIDSILENTFWELEKAEDFGNWTPKRFLTLSEQIKKAIYI